MSSRHRPDQFAGYLLDPSLKLAVVHALKYAADEQRSGEEFVAVGLDKPYSVTKVYETASYAYLVGVMKDPDDPKLSLALIAGPMEGKDRKPGVLAVSCTSAAVRWRTSLGPELTQPRIAVADGPDHAVLAEEVDPTTKQQHTRVWRLDLRTGDAQRVGEIPGPGRSLAVVPREAGGPGVLVAARDVWWLPIGSGEARGRKLVENHYGPVTVRYDPVRGAEAYAATPHCLWRLALRDASAHRVWAWGTADQNDKPPRIVGGI
jgi:hypothetical protein